MFLNKFKPLLPAVTGSQSCLVTNALLKSSVLQPGAWLHTSAALERARKGTRERKMKIAQANRRKKTGQASRAAKGLYSME